VLCVSLRQAERQQRKSALKRYCFTCSIVIPPSASAVRQMHFFNVQLITTLRQNVACISTSLNHSTMTSVPHMHRDFTATAIHCPSPSPIALHRRNHTTSYIYIATASTHHPAASTPIITQRPPHRPRTADPKIARCPHSIHTKSSTSD
jgi:hypothetical protein